MTPVRAIAEIVLNARDLESLARFYEDVLGFERFGAETHASDGDAAPTIVFLKIGELTPPFGTHHPQMLVLIDPARHTYAAGKFDPPGGRNSTLNHLAFQIDASEYDAELARLRGLGLEPVESAFPNLRSRAIFFRDPEQNRLEFICYDPDCAPSR